MDTERVRKRNIERKDKTERERGGEKKLIEKE